MKKQLVITAVMGAVISLTGCGTDITVPATQPGSSAQAATEAVTASGETASTSAVSGISGTSAASGAAEAANGSKDTAATPAKTNGKLTLGKSIFGGSVTADTAVKSKADESAETLITIPAYTQIGVHESGIDGWFMTEFKDTIGYIPAKSVKEIEPYDPELGLNELLAGSVNANGAALKVMSGTHSYAEKIAEIPDGTQINYYLVPDNSGWGVVNYNGKIGYIEARYIKPIEDFNAGVTLKVEDIAGDWYYLKPDSTVGAEIEISADGSFSETVAENYGYVSGKVKAEHGTYVFYDSSNSVCHRFTPDPGTPGEYMDDTSENGRLVNQRDYNKPNAYGFYDIAIMPPSSVSVSALTGTWKNADSGETLEINEGRSIYHGRFILTDASGNEVRGSIYIQYLINQSGNREDFFTFYEDSGDLRFALGVTDTIQLTDLYGNQSGTPHFVRQ